MGVSEAPARRKLLYDEETGRYSFETRTANLARLCGKRFREATIVNRSETKQLEFRHRQFSRAKHLFDMRLDTDVSEARSSLRDYVAHRHVLEAVAAARAADPAADPALGRYGPGAAFTELAPEIEREKTRMEPVRS